MSSKYDAHHSVLEKTYGALADLRRELSDSKAAVAERTELLRLFADCPDSQRSWLLLEDYFEKLSLSRKDFSAEDWWPRLLEQRGRERIEATALLFQRARRPLPAELLPYADFERFRELEKAELDQELVRQLEQWLLPAQQAHLDSPRATFRVRCEPKRCESGLFDLALSMIISRPRTGGKEKTLQEIVELTARSGHEEELFAPSDWAFIRWIAARHSTAAPPALSVSGVDLLQWLAPWAREGQMELHTHEPLRFLGEVAELVPQLDGTSGELSFTHQLQLPDLTRIALDQALFFNGYPALALAGCRFYLVRNAPDAGLLGAWVHGRGLPVRKLSHRLLTQFRNNGPEWEQLCVAHRAVPQFVFELNDETIRLRLMAKSDRDGSDWQWTGHEWQMAGRTAIPGAKPEILDDPRLSEAIGWLRRLDWFTPEPSLWVGDANDNFLDSLSAVWPERPATSEYLGNVSFHRLFLSARRLRPRLIVQGSGIDWFSVSAQWEAEGMKLTPADLARLQNATSRFVKLPDAGWMQLDIESVQGAQEAMADLGIDGLAPSPQRVSMAQAAHMDERMLSRFGMDDTDESLRSRLAKFSGLTPMPLPSTVQAQLRPYQKEGFDFLCHLTRHRQGGILADDMGLGKTLQTLSWLAWRKEQQGETCKPALVICPASVLHNWRRECERFTPHMRVLVLESGAARHNLRKQIPQHDLIVTNYALLRRDLAALKKFAFQAIILDEAQFIKNPSAQVTQSVKQLKADQRLALTGTPLENRLLDLWSIADFVEPDHLGSQEQFVQRYEPRTEQPGWNQRVSRRRLTAKLRPILLRRLKQQVAQDLPDRIEERRDCELHSEQRKLYLAELRRSREQVFRTLSDKGLAKSKLHILAALTRIRQICCHPRLVGSDSPSGKTETLFELLEPLLEQGHKVLVFSQFVQMLELLDQECRVRNFPTYLLTGQSKNRQATVNAFQEDPNAAVFLLSLRAAGTGLNLTTASYVVLYDPWWNPAVEAQAIDRSHRIGQTRTVNAYRLIAPGTVEEKIWELQQRKAQTITDVLGEEGFARSLTMDDLQYLFAEEADAAPALAAELPSSP